MILLIVEDDLNVIEALHVALAEFRNENEVRVYRSRDAAQAAIRGQSFDYAILDLKIPTADDLLDAEVDHGRSVYRDLRATLPGTPVCFLTAFGTEDFITDLLQEAERLDIWGSGEQSPMVRMLSKRRMSEILNILIPVRNAISAVEDVELILEEGLALTSPEARVLRIFARRNQAASILVSKLSGGLSGVRVLKLSLRDQNGATRLTVAARLGNRTEITVEIEAYRREIVRLPNGRFTTFTGDVFAGAGASAGVFYLLIEDFQPLSEMIKTAPARAAQVVLRVEEAERRWTNDQPQRQKGIVDVRRILTTDPEFAAISGELGGIDVAAFERRRIQVRMCAQHRDLHSENILVDAYGEPVLIDFASVGDGPASLDPITLEFSLVFHPGCSMATGTWPTPRQAEEWYNLDEWVRACPAEDFVRNARAWSNRVAAGRRELYATVYAYAVKQMRYADTNKELARAIIRGAIRAIEST